MSSHHIVREKQEPALLIMAIDAFDEEYLGQLLEWSPTVLVPAYLAEKVASMGIKIDVVFADESTSLQEHIKILPGGLDILESALKYLVAEGYPAVNIITNHFQAKEYLFFVEFIDVVVFSRDRKIYPIKSGFSKWKNRTEEIYILHPALIHNLSFSGLKQKNLAHYKTVKDGFFSFTFDQPFIFIAEQL